MWSTIALLLQAIVCASDAADTSGGPGEITPTSIVGGHTIDPNFKYPWMASLREDNSHFCGGVLLNPTTLLTAAHCSQFTSTEGLTVTVHRNDLRKTVAQEQGALFTVKSIKAHPKYNDEIMSNDAAIWKLELIEGTVPPLPKFSFDTGAKSKAGTSLTIAGWGGTSSRGLSNILLEVDVPVSTDAACKKAYPDVSPTVSTINSEHLRWI